MKQSEPPAGETRPGLSVQVIVALVGLVGVLGGAALANWDKLFPDRKAMQVLPPPAASVAAAANSSTGMQSPVVSGVGGNVTINIGEAASAAQHREADVQAVQQAWLGTWQSPLTPSVYDSKSARLRLHFERFGNELIGTTVEIDPSGKDYPPREMHDLKVQSDVASFHTEGSVCCTDGKEVPYTERYRLRRQGDSIVLTRQNNVDGGGELERFTLTALDSEAAKR